MPKRILLAEDDEDLRLGLKRRLAEDGFEVMAVGNGQEAIQRIKEVEAPFDLVLADYTMPGADGIKVIEVAKKTAEATKAVLMSGRDVEGLAALARMIGADDFLQKPTDFMRNGRLKEVIHRLLA